jgi:hypothetical protein
MLKEKIELIIDTLVKTTESGNLLWEEDSSSYDRRYKRRMQSVGEDSSLYELEIEYKLVNEKFILDNQPSLWIKNPKLPNGMFYIYGGKYDIIKLRDLILSKFLSNFTPSLGDLEDTLDEIAKGVNVSEFREGKINKILGFLKIN